jgi:hypothetical protein
MNEKAYDVEKIVKIVMENDDVSDALYNAVMDRNLEMLKKRRTYEEVAKKMKDKNEPIEKIVEFTGLDKEDIEKL